MQYRRLWARGIGVDRRVVIDAVEVDESDDSIVVSCRPREEREAPLRPLRTALGPL